MLLEFQPFLRFWSQPRLPNGRTTSPVSVSTLLEILVAYERANREKIRKAMFQPFLRFWGAVARLLRRGHSPNVVSTLLEILVEYIQKFGLPLVEGWVSTLLEILRLLCLVVVGF